MMTRTAAPGPALGALAAQGLRPFASWGLHYAVGFLLGKDLSVCTAGSAVWELLGKHPFPNKFLLCRGLSVGECKAGRKVCVWGGCVEL